MINTWMSLTAKPTNKFIKIIVTRMTNAKSIECDVIGYKLPVNLSSSSSYKMFSNSNSPNIMTIVLRIEEETFLKAL